MALAILLEIPGVTREQYEGVAKAVNAAGPPRGSLFHAGGPIEGGWRIVEMWESREAADAFYASDVLRKATAGLPQAKVLLTWPVHAADVGQGWKPLS
jgi:hypothetical protein